jgi:hypothetical protein
MTVQHKVLHLPPSHFNSHHLQPDRVPEIQHRRVFSLQAGLAEMMLVNRLRAHTRCDLSLDSLHLGAKVVALTAKHWFGDK